MADRVLVVIDMQRIFSDPGSPWATPGFGQIVPNIERLAKAYDPNVVFTRFVMPATPEGAWQDYCEAWPFALRLAAEPCAPSYQLAEPFAGRPTVDLPSFGKWGPALATAAKPGGTLILTGVSTDCCVLSTALAAVDAGMHVQVVSDACAGADEKSHQRALDVMALYGPQLTVVKTADL